MRDLTRILVAAILALVLPVQGMAHLLRDVRGPAHYHVSAMSMPSVLDHPGHSHSHPEHHHHASSDGVVEVDDDDDDHHGEGVEEGAAKRGAAATPDALLHMHAIIHPAVGAPESGGWNAIKPPPPPTARLERPPKPEAM